MFITIRGSVFVDFLLFIERTKLMKKFVIMIMTCAFLTSIFLATGYCQFDARKRAKEAPLKNNKNAEVVKETLDSDLDPAASSLRVRYSYPVPRVNRVALEDKVYDEISLNNVQNFAEPGQPLLPLDGHYILIPQGKKVVDISVKTDDAKSLGTGFIVRPESEPVFVSDDRGKPLPIPNEDIYSSNEMFPGEIAKKVSSSWFRGYQILALNIAPVQFIPSSGEVLYYRDITIHVTLAQDRDPVHPLFRGSKTDRLEIRRRVENPSVADTYLDKVRNVSETAYDMVIITGADLVNGLVPLKNMHDSTGVSTHIVTVEDIYQNYPGVDNPEKIRNFIISAYNDWQVDYVLLAGDAGIIPARLLRPSQSGDATVVSDQYYSCLDGPYNADGDQYWGEIHDGENGEDIDFFAEVYIGRATIENSQEVQNFVNKTIAYVNLDPNSDYLKKVSLMGEHIGEDYWGGDALDRLIDGAFYNNKITVGLPSHELDIETLYDENWPYNQWPKQEVINLINSGVHIINHHGHSGTDLNMKILSNPDVLGLTNEKLCFIYSAGCSPGYFVRYNEDVIAEYFTIKTENAAVFGIWYTCSSSSYVSEQLQSYFWDSVFYDGLIVPSMALQSSKEKYAYAYNGTAVRQNVFGLTLFGDPAVHFNGSFFDESVVKIADILHHNVLENELYTFQVQLDHSDPQKTYLYSLSSAPEEMEIDSLTGAISWIPQRADVGANHICVKVADADDPEIYDLEQYAVVVDYINHPPVANDDSATLYENLYTYIYVLDNDSDPDLGYGDSLTIDSIVNAPAGGTAVISNGTRIRYAANNGFVGLDSFAYAVRDASGEMDTAEVSVFVKDRDVLLHQGWNLFSLNMNNWYPSKKLSYFLQSLIDQGIVEIVKDDTSHVIWPEYGIDTIGLMKATEGYQIKVTQDAAIPVYGSPVNSSSLNISLQQGWNIVGYPMLEEHPGLAFVKPLIEQEVLIEVIDENNQKIYHNGSAWVNQIGNFKPGEGYHIKLSASAEMKIPEDSFFLSGNIKDSNGNDIEAIAPITIALIGEGQFEGINFTAIIEEGDYDYYIPNVIFGWTGTINVTSDAYNFEMMSPGVTVPLTEKRNNLDFEATLKTYIISGTVTCNGQGVEGVEFKDSHGVWLGSTGPTGEYFFNLPYEWTDIIIPTKEHYTFLPESQAYSWLRSDQAQDFIATKISASISGEILYEDGSPLGGVEIKKGDEVLAVTGSNGLYSFSKPAGWSGTVHPEKANYIFDPESREYTDLEQNQESQDYEASTEETFTQIVELHEGWNNFAPIVIAQSMHVEDLLAPLVLEGKLVTCYDRTGSFYNPNTGLNQISQPLSVGYGVTLQLNAPTTLFVPGESFTSQVTVDLFSGNNYIGFPVNKNAMETLQGLIDAGVLVYVMDRTTGGTISYYGGTWIDSIGQFVKGRAYWIVVNQNSQIDVQ